MNIEKNNLLKSNGCYTDKLNQEDYNILKNIFINHQEGNFTNACHTGYGNNYSNNTPFKELKSKKIDCLEKNTAWQYWYFDSSIRWEKDEFEWFKNICNKIVVELYPIEVFSKFDQIKHINYTLFDKGCFIKNHRDGGSGAALCNILFYLNENYKEGDGGELVVEKEHIIKPEFGRYGVIDFYYSNPEHQVTPILNETFERKTFLTSIPLIETLHYPENKYL